ncbi:MAG: cytochrome c peroxidase [Armatimonadota bacterium]
MKNSYRGLSLGWITGLSGGLFLAALFLPGCGGGSAPTFTPASDTVTTGASGRAVFTVVWPVSPATRLIPMAARSIRVDILRSNGTVVASQRIVRPDSGSSSTTTMTFQNLPVDTLTASAVALPQADGSGTAQAIGSVPLTIQADQTIQFSLTMSSTIDHLVLNPITLTLTAGQRFQMTGTALDAPDNAGNIVLTAPEKMQWASSNSAVASVDENGLVTALSAGTATVSVTDQESGKSASATVTSVLPNPPTDPFAGVHEYLNLDLDNLFNYANPVYPVHYDAAVRGQDNTPPNNPVTNRGATLGRVLFFDKRLSVKDTVACSSCHQQANGMTDNRQFSTGFDGASFTTAHSMRLGNIRFYTGASMFWDKRAASVEAQASQPIQNSIEMGFDATHGGLNALIQKMAALPYYPELFRWVYGDTTITENRVQRALAQYERSMVSTSSRFDTEFARVFNPARPDRGIGVPFAGYTAQEERGKQLYILPPAQGGGGCVGCHQAPTFALAANSRSNGLDAGETVVFKSPSLKNVGRTGPYMHDGRFQSLEQVVDHYIRGVQNGPALDNRLRNGAGQPLRLNLTTADRDALAAFLRTLNDDSLTSDPKFSNPFRN